jgi:glycosyltransferase involved in cell wall biosynthesis
MTEHKQIADVCLVLEGTYPYVSGGVSTWAHELIKAQSHLTFHLVCILPSEPAPEPRYDMPDNIIGLENVFLHNLPAGAKKLPRKVSREFFSELERPLLMLQAQAETSQLKHIIQLMKDTGVDLGSRILLDSPDCWQMLQRMYLSSVGSVSFLDYFWSWRTLFGGLFAILLAKIPEAKSYHSLCTGYAGIYMARAYVETGKPCAVTEHGIYTNERRIEIASAEWIQDTPFQGLNIQETLGHRDLRDVWIDEFSGYSKICYQACEKIITLYEGNQVLQRADGAEEDKLSVIANGIDVKRFGSLKRKPHERPTIALIGRIVPIKDIKTFILACALIRNAIPDLRALLIGPTGEDEEYVKECMDLIEHESLQDTLELTGKVLIDDYLPEIDVQILTSISEAQPLVLLEVGAMGIPSVATDVGSCREILQGRSDEVPALGAGGAVTMLSNPSEVADSVIKLLKDEEHYRACSETIRKRVEKYYNEKDQHSSYKKMYADLIKS